MGKTNRTASTSAVLRSTSLSRGRLASESSDIAALQGLLQLADANGDGAISKGEMAKLNAEKLELFKQFDTDNDGTLDDTEFKLAQMQLRAETRLSYLKTAQSKYEYLVGQRGHYRDFFAFVAFVCFYFAILFMQREAFIAYDVTYTLSQTVLPLDSSGDPLHTYTDYHQVYSWLTGLVVSIWTDPKCGDGQCDAPYEYKEFGTPSKVYGCGSDCGPALTTDVVITASSRYKSNSESSDQVDFIRDTVWNLCTTYSGLQTGNYDLSNLNMLQFTEDDGQYYPDAEADVLCFYPEWNTFSSSVQDVVKREKLPDAEWKVLLFAPYGGVRITVYDDESSVLAQINFCRDYCSTDVPCDSGYECSFDQNTDTTGICQPSFSFTAAPPPPVGSPGAATNTSSNDKRGEAAAKWVLISMSTACGRDNAEVGEEVRTPVVVDSLEHCKMLCEIREDCMAIDFYTTQSVCLMFSKACSTPAAIDIGCSWAKASAFTAADTPTVPDTSWHMTYTGECAESEGMTQAVILLNALGEQPDDYVLEVVPKAAAQATVYLQQGHDASRRLLQGKDSGGGAAPSDGGAAPSDGGAEPSPGKDASPADTTPSATAAPVTTSSSSAPTSFPTSSPTTLAPITVSPTTIVPTTVSPATATPTATPTTPSPTTVAPTAAPTTDAPTATASFRRERGECVTAFGSAPASIVIVGQPLPIIVTAASLIKLSSASFRRERGECVTAFGSAPASIVIVGQPLPIIVTAASLIKLSSASFRRERGECVTAFGSAPASIVIVGQPLPIIVTAASPATIAGIVLKRIVAATSLS
ncbi:hypothetical protein CYMTET_45805 [Cymbomonas tetramitiformis]|uniref:EF-hand domain-containing protein n=1 Tax=Cymbomonas tetramitiformis TaxID=36881 RepID=A0AAE0BYS4_9CHLO|nr:hypothetical protein CYMTET_45805 [Cymbomonas tetramitiformis]